MACNFVAPSCPLIYITGLKSVVLYHMVKVRQMVTHPLVHHKVYRYAQSVTFGAHEAVKEHLTIEL